MPVGMQRPRPGWDLGVGVGLGVPKWGFWNGAAGMGVLGWVCQGQGCLGGDARVRVLGWGMLGWGCPGVGDARMGVPWGGGAPGWGCPRVDTDASSPHRTVRWCWVLPAGTTSWVSPACRALPPGLDAPGIPNPRVGLAGGGHPGWGSPIGATGSPGLAPGGPCQSRCPPHCPPGLLYSVEVDAILTRFHGKSLLWLESPGQPTAEQSMVYEDGYRGEPRAWGSLGP